MGRAPKGMKMRIFGIVLLCLSAVTALLARTVGFELNVFYIVIAAAGACMFAYGSILARTKQDNSEPRMNANRHE